jgi:hypothetical protein
MNIPGYKIIGPVAYQGKEGCDNPRCTRAHYPDESGYLVADMSRCVGYHCVYCGEPCGSQGHKCPASEAILGEARRLIEEEE